MSEEEIKYYYERIEKLLNGANKETYGFVPEEIRQILKWYEKLQQESQQLKERYENLMRGYKFLNNRVKQGMSNENKNICLIELGNQILRELEKGDSNGQ